MTEEHHTGADPFDRYREAVELLLQSRFGSSIDAIHAEKVVAAAFHAGYSPEECIDWLARVDGL